MPGLKSVRISTGYPAKVVEDAQQERLVTWLPSEELADCIIFLRDHPQGIPKMLAGLSPSAEGRKWVLSEWGVCFSPRCKPMVYMAGRKGQIP